jgi:hypothetical protein
MGAFWDNEEFSPRDLPPHLLCYPYRGEKILISRDNQRGDGYCREDILGTVPSHGHCGTKPKSKVHSGNLQEIISHDFGGTEIPVNPSNKSSNGNRKVCTEERLKDILKTLCVAFT